jgi:hypothetical protein
MKYRILFFFLVFVAPSLASLPPSPSPLPQFLLHIGPHKTASSFLQESLDKNADIISKFGYHVLTKEKYGAVFALTLKKNAQQKIPEHSKWYTDQVDLFQEFVTTIRRRNMSIILSSEELDDLKENAMAMLRDMLAGYNTTIIFFHRERLQLLRSTWAEMTRVNCTLKFISFLSNQMQRNLTDFGGLEMSETLHRYTKAFGSVSLHIILYDALVTLHLDPLKYIFRHILGISDIPLRPIVKVVNQSPKSDLFNCVCPVLV